MANIPVYRPQIRYPHVVDTGGDIAGGAAATAEAFRSVGQNIAQTAEVIDRHVSQQETSKLTKTASDTLFGLTSQWNDVAAKTDPNDIDKAAEDFTNNTLNPTIEKLGGDLFTREANQLKARMQVEIKGHLQNKILADQSALNGVAVQKNLNDSVNTLSQTAYADPTSAAAGISLFNQNLDAQLATHKITPETAATIRRELTDKAGREIETASGRAMAERNPDELLKAINSGQFKYLDGLQLSQLNTYAIQQQEAKKRDERQAKEDAIKDAGIASDNRRNEIMKGLSVNGRVKIPPNAQAQILADPVMNAPDKDALLGIVKRLSEPDANQLRNDPGTYIGLFDRIHLPDDNPRKITNEDDLNQFLGRGLNYTGYSQLRQEIQGKKTEEGSVESDLKKDFVAKIKRDLTQTNPFLNIKDTKGDDNFSRWLYQFLPAYDAAVRAGKNPVELLNPDGDFAKSALPYHRTLQQQMRDIMQGVGPILPGQPAGAGGTAPTLAPELPAPVKGATQTQRMRDKKSGKEITGYLLNGKWVDETGKPL